MKKILLIEDEGSLAKMYQIAFRRYGQEIFVARDHETALEVWCKEKPDLVLLDIIIPDYPNAPIEFSKREGWNLLKMIRQSETLKNTKVAALTNLATPQDREMAKQMGCLDYIVKASSLPMEVVAQSEKWLK